MPPRSAPTMLLADTNVLVALVAGPADAHHAQAVRLVRRLARAVERLLVTEGVLIETAWVLQSRFALSRREIASLLVSLLDSASLDSWDPPLVTHALRVMAEEPRPDLVDALLVARDAAGDGRVATFDRLLAQVVSREHGRR